MTVTLDVEKTVAMLLYFAGEEECAADNARSFRGDLAACDHGYRAADRAEMCRSLASSLQQLVRDAEGLDWLQGLLDRGEKITDVTLWRNWDGGLDAAPLYAISQSHWSESVSGKTLREMLANAQQEVDLPSLPAKPASSPTEEERDR